MPIITPEYTKYGMTVRVENGNMTRALQMLKRRFNDEGLKKELRNREHFVSKGQKRRKARAAAIRRATKANNERLKLDSLGQ